jgi:hypothetical protein
MPLRDDEIWNTTGQADQRTRDNTVYHCLEVRKDSCTGPDESNGNTPRSELNDGHKGVRFKRQTVGEIYQSLKSCKQAISSTIGDSMRDYPSFKGARANFMNLA